MQRDLRANSTLSTGFAFQSSAELFRLAMVAEMMARTWQPRAARTEARRQLPYALRRSTTRALRRKTKLSAQDGATAAPASKSSDVLRALDAVIDPDFGLSVVECGFVKDLVCGDDGNVSFTLELTTPACPVKAEFERQSKQVVSALPWVTSVDVTFTASPAAALDAPPTATVALPGLKGVRHVIAVSSCKGGVGKSTTSVNLAYTLAMMGARVGIFDADVYGPSLPMMVSPDEAVMGMDPETREIEPCEYEGVKLVSFGFAGQGAAIMRGAMVSGLIEQMIGTARWGELDYLILDFPPGTGDIQLTLCQSVPITAAVVVTTPQALAYADVSKGIRMFARLSVPVVSVVENMSYFEAPDGQRYTPFGEGSGKRAISECGLPDSSLVQLPIAENLSAAGDGGVPHVVSDPTSALASDFSRLGATVVREVAKLSRTARDIVRYDDELKLCVVRMPASSPGEQREQFGVRAIDVLRSDARALMPGEPHVSAGVPDDIAPESITPVGNYAVQISWPNGINQVAPLDVIAGLERVAIDELASSAAAA